MFIIKYLLNLLSIFQSFIKVFVFLLIKLIIWNQMALPNLIHLLLLLFNPINVIIPIIL